jgi:RNA polymerase sigma-70 factor, ECF subfamily
MTLAEKDVLQVMMTHRHRIAAAAWVIVRDAHAAEDIFQNVALKALTKDVSFEAQGAVLSWAFVAARREGLDWLRKHKREMLCLDSDIAELMDREWLAEASKADGGKMEALRECIEDVPEASRQLLRLRYFDGLQCEEVARKLGAGLDAVYKRLSRLHQALKECIESRVAGTTALEP